MRSIITLKGLLLKSTWLLTITLLLVSQSFGQKTAKRDFGTMMDSWWDGNIQVDGHTTLHGLLRFNNFEGILTYKSRDSEVERTFNARNIQGFDIASGGNRRHFISSPSKMSSKEVPESYFFEILCELKHFAILSRETSYANRMTTMGSNFTPETTSAVVREETLFVFDDEGNISPYMVFVNINEANWLFERNKKSKAVLNRKLLKKYMGKFYAPTKAYAKKHHFSFKSKNELLRILDHYKVLEQDGIENDSSPF